jgi:ribosomal protein S18 acetylase RimI-like enzyme
MPDARSTAIDTFVDSVPSGRKVESRAMGEITIREARSEEVDDILALWKAAGSGPSVTDTPDHLRMLTEKNGDLFLVAEEYGRLVGSIIGGWDGWRGHIYRLAVHPDVRRRGLARSLTAEIERRLRAKGAVRIYALAATKQEMGVKFWESLPYEKSKDVPYVRTFDRPSG